MNKKKAIIHINTVSKMLGNTLSTGILQHIQDELNLALSELQKSDWISVEDELPPYGERVLVCNKYHTNNVWLSHREDEKSLRKQDKNGFPAWYFSYHPYSITHWSKIDKLKV